MHRACILAHVFSRLLLQFSFFFLVLQALGHPTLPSPVFWYLDFDSSRSICIAYKLSCLNWACCAQVFYAVENGCRLLLAISYREFTAVMCYFLFSPRQREKDFYYLNMKIKLHSLRALKQYLNNKNLAHGQKTIILLRRILNH